MNLFDECIDAIFDMGTAQQIACFAGVWLLMLAVAVTILVLCLTFPLVAELFAAVIALFVLSFAAYGLWSLVGILREVMRKRQGLDDE